jgi:putative nucleotidyltransferase with HDIG domain
MSDLRNDRMNRAAPPALSVPAGRPGPVVETPQAATRKLGDYLVDLPPMPMVALKVMHLVDDPTTNTLELARTIAADQAITFKVLQLANSSYYGYRRQIMTLTQAIAVLGVRTIRSLVLLYSIPASLKRGGRTGPQEKALWEHSVGTALTARLLAQKAGNTDPEMAFVAGLLHDLGKSILLFKEPDEMSRVLYDAWPPGGTIETDDEKKSFGFDHAEVGARVLEEWTFPVPYVEAARRHHQPEFSGDYAWETRLVAAANRISHHLGLGAPADPAAWQDAVRLGEALGLEDGKIELVAVTALNQLTAERALYDL